MEAGGALALLGNGQSIDPTLINPRIQFCTSRADHNIFRYAKLFQKVPTTNRVGRQIRALVYDTGQNRPVLMGILELTSGAYTGSRDKFLNWIFKVRVRALRIKAFVVLWTSRLLLLCPLTTCSAAVS